MGYTFNLNYKVLQYCQYLITLFKKYTSVLTIPQVLNTKYLEQL